MAEQPIGTIVCRRGGSRHGANQLCSKCHARAGTQLCDGPLPDGMLHRRSSVPGASTTCSVPLCPSCAHRVGPDTDLCDRCFALREAK